MRLYAGMSRDFIEDAVQNRIAAKLRDAFLRHYRYRPSVGEEQSWRNSLRAMSQVLERGTLHDHGVILEYQLPQNSRRLDCLLTGRDGDNRDEAVIVELKQWSTCEETDEASLVRAVVAGGMRDVLHPSAQVNQYRQYLADMHTAFYEGEAPVLLSACSYLHNYEAANDDPLFRSCYREVLERAPAFCADDVGPLVDYLQHRLERGQGRPVLDRVEQSKYRPSKKLLEHVASVIETEPAFVLLDEQKVVFDRIFGTVVKGHEHRRKHVYLVNGGPGTGKSVIAIQLMAELSRRGRNAQYATGSQAFTRTLHRILGSRAAPQFRFFNSYGTAAPSEVDVLICDEAHRLRPTSTNRFTARTGNTGKPQIQEIIDAAKVAVFLIDDRQVVRPGEVGSSDLVRQTADKNGCEFRQFELAAQFRCSGSDGFVNWIENTLGIQETANVLWNQREESFDFRIFPTPRSLDEAIHQRSAEGFSARMTAGYCWPWSKKLLLGGHLVEDVVIDDYRRPWNARSGVSGLAKGIPREVHWAHDPRGIHQIGCVYTAQGFEFDYVGVIWGQDLAYDPRLGGWTGDKTKSKDPVVQRSGDQFMDFVRNTYRVLLSRGLKGCYVHFLDQDTETFVRSRIEGLEAPRLAAGQRLRPPAVRQAPRPKLPALLKVVSEPDVQPYVNAVPLLDLRVAAGFFSEEQIARRDTIWVALPETFRISKDLSVAQVTGESMNRRIPNGAWCLFRAYRGGSRDGKIVAVEHREISDVDTGTHLTVKRYRSEKAEAGEDQWRHVRIVLSPESNDPKYKPIELSPRQADDLRVIAEHVAVLD